MGFYQETLKNYEEGFFANVAVGVIAQSCLGAVAAMYILQNGTSFPQMIQLFLAVAACMLYNGAVLSTQKPKVVLNTLIISVVINTILTIANMIM